MTTPLKSWAETVRLDLQPNARFAANEFAGAKINSWALNLTWAERAQGRGFDEVILLNEHGRVAECTSANVFAVRGEDVLTPPLSEGCLGGITREVLLNEIRAPGIRIVEGPLSPEDLYRADEVFITSTTRDLLTVREIAGTGLATGQSGVSRRILAAFREFVAQDVRRRHPVSV
jgi:branched-chain amino acid aminotransferase